MLYHAEDNKEQPTILIQELLHEAAFGSNTPLGHTLYATEEGARQITVQDLEKYMERALQPHKVVITGAGVAHDDLVEIAEKEFGHLPSVPESERVTDVPPQECVRLPFSSTPLCGWKGCIVFLRASVVLLAATSDTSCRNRTRTRPCCPVRRCRTLAWRSRQSVGLIEVRH